MTDRVVRVRRVRVDGEESRGARRDVESLLGVRMTSAIGSFSVKTSSIDSSSRLTMMPSSPSQVRLRIDVEREDAVASPCERDRQIVGGRRLADAPFLIRDGDRSHGSLLSPRREQKRCACAGRTVKLG